MTQIDDDDDLQSDPDVIRIKPRTSALTIALCFFNLLAVLAFFYLLLMTLSRRHQWMDQAFYRSVAIQGRPLAVEANGLSDANALAPKETLDPEWLKAAYEERGGKKVSERFREASLELQPILPQQTQGLSDEVLKWMFKEGGGTPVKTLDEEVARLKQELPGMIKKAAEGAKEKFLSEKDRRDRLQKELFALAITTDQVAALDKAMQAVAPPDLAEVLIEASQRRMIADILDVMEEFRPWYEGAGVDGNKLNKKTDEDSALQRLVALKPLAKGLKPALSADRYSVPLADLEARLQKRLDSILAAKDPKERPRNGLEKRRNLGFLLLALARVRTPDGTALYPMERVEIVSGAREFSHAADNMLLVLGHIIDKRLQVAIERDRGRHYIYPLGYRITNPDLFAVKLKELLARLKIPVADEKAFVLAVKQHFEGRQGKLETPEQVLAETKGLLAKLQIKIPEPKAGFLEKTAEFDREVYRLVDDREVGFVGRHHQALRRIQDIIKRIADQEVRLQELLAQEKEAQRQLTEREDQLKKTTTKLIAQREKTLQLAESLRQRQEERFRAQIELADADRLNQYMARRIAVLELTRKRGK